MGLLQDSCQGNATESYPSKALATDTEILLMDEAFQL